MAQATLRNNDGNPFLYLEGSTGSMAFGVDTTNNEQVNLVTSDAVQNVDPTSSTPSIAIKSTTPGDIEFSPKGIGQSTFLNGDVEILGAGATAGNLLMQDTTAAGLAGVIEYGGNRFVHNKGTDNTFVGSLAGNLGTTGNSSVAVGTNALNNDTSLIGMTAIGFDALTNLSAGIQNTAVGYKALASATSANQNTAVGYESLTALTAPGIGGGLNAAYGTASLRANTLGRFNTALGCQALVNLNGNGTNDIFNLAVGIQAGFSMTSGINNTLVGPQAGVATLLGSGLLTGNNNVIIGAHAGENYTGAETSNVLISNTGTVGESFAIHIGTSGTHTTATIAGVNGVTVTPAGTVVISSTGQLGTSSAPFSTTWQEVAIDTNMVANNGYIADSGVRLNLTLPVTVPVGTVFEVVNKGAGGWKIVQNAGQFVNFGFLISTVGAAGFIQSSEVHNCVKILCITADIEFIVISSVGNITVA